MSILRIISGTPLKVWILFVFLLFLGVRALRPSTVSVWRIALLPTFFFC
jgi:hypothetical protein